MALGGGIFTAQNKVLPGAYMNFVSASAASPALSERGVVTMPLELDWGMENEIFKVSNEDFQRDSRKLFGYVCSHEKMKGLADLFLGARTLYVYRLNGGGTKATNMYATARYCGIRGNDLKIAIQVNADKANAFDVMTYLDAVKVDTQTVTQSSELIANDFVIFKTTELVETASTPLAGGTNGTVDGEAYQVYADKAEAYTFNTMGVATTDETVKKMFIAYNKRLRDEMGIKFQLVLYNAPADYMGIINVKNRVKDEGISESSLVYWVTGAEAGCPVNKSCQNKKYDGSFIVDSDFTQFDLRKSINAGELVLHKVNDEIRILSDINSMVTATEDCGEVFKENQTVRVIDQLANDDAVLFNTKYLGAVPNNDAGRISLQADLAKIRQSLQDIQAIEGFSDSDVVVGPGETKKSVIVSSTVTVVNAMSQLYMSTTVA